MLKKIEVPISSQKEHGKEKLVVRCDRCPIQQTLHWCTDDGISEYLLKEDWIEVGDKHYCSEKCRDK